MDGKISALEEYYRQTHVDVLNFSNQNHTSELGAEARNGKVLDTGFDYNHGKNVIWSPSEQMFVLIDW